MRALAAVAWLAVLLAAHGCGGEEEAAPTTPASPGSIPVDTAVLSISGFAFVGGDVSEGAPIDPLFTCDGRGSSPALSWRETPERAVELALLMQDPDAPGGTYTHWVAYAIPPELPGLEAGIPTVPAVSGTVTLRQGLNDAGESSFGYAPPCPPGDETHRYVFTLYALDEETGLEGGATVDQLLEAIDGHVIAEATLTATYSRS